MVFYDRDERKRRGRAPLSSTSLRSAGTSLTDLADELLLEIIKDYDTSQILQCRLIHPRLTAVANDLLSQRLRCLYLHAARTALYKASQICEHPTFSKKIDELVVLGGNRAVKDRDECQVLLDRLSKLNVRKLVYANKVYKPGFTSVFNSQHRQQRRVALKETEGPDTHLMYYLVSWLNNSEVKLQEVSFRTRLPQNTPVPNQHICASLTHIDLALDARLDKPTPWGKWCCSLLSHTDALQSLTLSVDGVSKYRRIDEQSILSLLLSERKHWAYLKTLKIRLRHDKGFWTTKVQRPACMVFNCPTQGIDLTMLDFLQAHSSTLQEVEFDNVLFPTLGSPGRTAVLTLLDILSHLFENIEHFTWKVNFFEHHQWCKMKEGSGIHGRCRDFLCGLYHSPTGGRTTSVFDLSDCAQTLGLDLEEGEFWNFAKANRHAMDEAVSRLS